MSVVWRRPKFGAVRPVAPALLRCAVVLAAALVLRAAPAAGQQAEPVEVRGEVFPGSEIEGYLRALQLQGVVPLYPWSIRGFSAGELDRIAPADTTHPWAARYQLQPDSKSRQEFRVLRPHVRTVFNSGFPHGSNDGALWAGRGLTTLVQAGFAARYGPLSLTIAPVAFVAQNSDFELMSNGYPGPQAFADGRFPGAIDLPQRFGDGRYARLDPGQSTLRLDAAGVAIGVSTANQHWGPATEHPILLGTNAPGFPHAFMGTSAPVNLWVGRVHGRIVWGELAQSEYSTVEGRESRRFMSGLVGVFMPRGVPGLELGAARFFHTAWPEGGPGGDDFLRPLEGLLKGGLGDSDVLPGDPKSDPRNQLASVFFRWVFPRGGVEAFGEYGREDHSWDRRDLLLEPDHSAAYTLGLLKSWRTAESDLWVLRGETMNAQISHLSRVRLQVPIYTHFAARQGHTHRGQILGSPAGYGGAGSVVSVERYSPQGKWGVSWSRTVRQDRDTTKVGGVEDGRLDVAHALAAERLWFRGGAELSAGIAGVYNLNRDFDSDAFNLNASLGVRIGF